MARIGVDNLWAFPITKDDNTGTTYGQPFRIAKAISININPQSSEASLFADDKLVEYISEITAFDITINVDDLTAENKSKLLGHKPDEKGVIIESGNNNAPYLAIAFRARRSDGQYEYRVLYKVRFNPTEDRYETKGQSIQFQTPTITGKAMALESSGDKNKFGAYAISKTGNEAYIAGWFKAPYGATEEE